MKLLGLLLFTVITLTGFGAAAPYAAEIEAPESFTPVQSEETLLPRVEPEKIPVYRTISLSPQATSHHFYLSRTGVTNSDPAVAAVLSRMNPGGLFTAVIMRGAKTSFVGPPEGKTMPDKFIMSNSKERANALITNGGFFILGRDPLLRFDLNGTDRS